MPFTSVKFTITSSFVNEGFKKIYKSEEIKKVLFNAIEKDLNENFSSYYSVMPSSFLTNGMISVPLPLKITTPLL